jgi:hypothetical protein
MTVILFYAHVWALRCGGRGHVTCDMLALYPHSRSAAAATGQHERAVVLLQELVRDAATLQLPPSLPHAGHAAVPAAAALHWALAQQYDAIGDVNACAASAAAAATAAAAVPASSTDGTAGIKKKKKPKFMKDMVLQLQSPQQSCTARAANARANAAAAAVTAAAPVLLSATSSIDSRVSAIEHLLSLLSSSSAPSSPSSTTGHCTINFFSVFHPAFILSFSRSLLLRYRALPAPAQPLTFSLLHLIASPPPTSDICPLTHILEQADVAETLLDISVDHNELSPVRLQALRCLQLFLSCGRFTRWMRERLFGALTHVMESTALLSSSLSSAAAAASWSSLPPLPSGAVDSLAAAAADLIRHFFHKKDANIADAWAKVRV